jgi:hypothetical protein
VTVTMTAARAERSGDMANLLVWSAPRAETCRLASAAAGRSALSRQALTNHASIFTGKSAGDIYTHAARPGQVVTFARFRMR